PAGREADRVRDRTPRRGAVGDDDEAAEAEQIGAAVGVGIEPPAEPIRRRPDQETAELAARRGRDLLAERVEERLDRPLEELQADVAGEAVGDDDVGGAGEELAALDVALEAQVALGEEPVRLERELVPLLV